MTIQDAINVGHKTVTLNGHEWLVFWEYNTPKVCLVRRIRVTTGKHKGHGKQVTIYRNRGTVIGK